MFIRLHRGETVQNFNVWVYDNNGLVRESGLFVNKQGLAMNHHFFIPRDGTTYQFLEGEYLMQVFVEPVNHSIIKIFEQKLFITKDQHNEMSLKKAGIYFDWAPNSQNYLSHVDEGPIKDENLDNFLDEIFKGRVKGK